MEAPNPFEAAEIVTVALQNKDPIKHDTVETAIVAPQFAEPGPDDPALAAAEPDT